MSKSPSMVLLTTVPPDPENRGGPSGLPWEMLDELKKLGWVVDVQLVPLAVGTIGRRLMQLAVPTMSLKVDRTDADVYVAYPLYLSRFVPPELRSRTLVLGPDAVSMLYARFARINSGLLRWRSLSLSRWFAFHERWTLKHFAGMVVVGRNDSRWIKRMVGSPLSDRVHYLPHPVLRAVAGQEHTNGSLANPRLVLGGDLSQKYVGRFFETLDYDATARALCTVGCEVLIVGKGNRAIYDTIARHLPSSYRAWVDDYTSLCDPLRDVHAMPLMAGAGTKNRTLTALANNVVVISTPIGVENIDIHVLRSATVHRFRSGSDFANALAAALDDLSSRRLLGSPPRPPPISRITESFRTSLHRTLRLTIASHSSQSFK